MPPRCGGFWIHTCRARRRAEPRICSYHKLRHRHAGRYHWVEFHIMVPGWWEVQRGHDVASTIEYEIENALGEGNATAHIEPCVADGCENCRKQRDEKVSEEIRSPKSE